MTTQETPAKAQLWGGRIASGLAMFGLLASAGMKLSKNPEMLAMFSGKLGWPESSITTLAAIEIGCVLLYAVPKTAVLGAILLTGYLGGAVATHLRVGDSVVAPIVLGVVVWIGIWLRELGLRRVVPLRP